MLLTESSLSLSLESLLCRFNRLLSLVKKEEITLLSSFFQCFMQCSHAQTTVFLLRTSRPSSSVDTVWRSAPTAHSTRLTSFLLQIVVSSFWFVLLQQGIITSNFVDSTHFCMSASHPPLSPPSKHLVSLSFQWRWSVTYFMAGMFFHIPNIFMRALLVAMAGDGSSSSWINIGNTNEVWCRYVRQKELKHDDKLYSFQPQNGRAHGLFLDQQLWLSRSSGANHVFCIS